MRIRVGNVARIHLLDQPGSDFEILIDFFFDEGRHFCL